jgi:AMP nucleosidase
MPAYNLQREDGHGITIVNIGVGPSNAKNITDHLAVLRPNCWLMIGHCGGLRQSQVIGDYVLAHGYLRRDRILDDVLPLEVPVPALAEVQLALQEAAARVTGDRGDALKRRLRTGTVVTYDDRNWELRWSHERRRINLSRAIAVDMESGTLAAQGYRLRVPYGTLLCVSDKPLHGEIKLPGAATAFYQRAVGEHLAIGLETIDLLRDQLHSLHSRKLRAFDEPVFR